MMQLVAVAVGVGVSVGWVEVGEAVAVGVAGTAVWLGCTEGLAIGVAGSSVARGVGLFSGWVSMAVPVSSSNGKTAVFGVGVILLRWRAVRPRIKKKANSKIKRRMIAGTATRRIWGCCIQ